MKRLKYGTAALARRGNEMGRIFNLSYYKGKIYIAGEQKSEFSEMWYKIQQEIERQIWVPRLTSLVSYRKFKSKIARNRGKLRQGEKV